MAVRYYIEFFFFSRVTKMCDKIEMKLHTVMKYDDYFD